MDQETSCINKKELIDKISKLNNKEKEHILKLFISNDIQYTKNMNGYFFNLSTADINEKFLQQVANSISLIEKNRNVLQELDQNREFMLQQCKELIENKLSYTIKLKQNEYNKKISILTIPTNINVSCNKIYHPLYILKLKYTKELEPQKIIYDKNSVFFRINNNIKRTSRNKKIKNDNIMDSSNYDMENINETDNDNDNDILPENDDDEIISDNIEDEFVFDEKQEDDNATHDVTNDIDESDSDDMESNNSDYNERIFYKQLLDQHGFNFNYDNNCKLIFNNYLE
jgi:hypothetical protein